MLDETTCPVCGKELNGTQRLFEDDPVPDGIWAVAHYLAHLVQQREHDDIDSQPLRDPSETDDDDDGPDHLTWTADDVHSTDVHPVLSADVRNEL